MPHYIRIEKPTYGSNIRYLALIHGIIAKRKEVTA